MKIVDHPQRICPCCGSTDAVRIIYGNPSFETFVASQRGEGALGPWVISEESPDYERRTLRRSPAVGRAR